MKKSILTFALPLLVISSAINAQKNSNILVLEKRIQDQIVFDSKDQSDSFHLFTLRVSTNPDKQFPKISVMDSSFFMFQGGSCLRFYLSCIGKGDNISTLKLFRKSPSSSLPDILLKEVQCKGNEKKVASFDYILTEYEEFNLYLRIDNSQDLTAVAVATQYKPK